jgi:hypothetical protein
MTSGWDEFLFFDSDCWYEFSNKCQERVEHSIRALYAVHADLALCALHA